MPLVAQRKRKIVVSAIREQLLEAGVWQPGHVVLNSGRHSDVKLEMDKLLERRNQMRLRVVMHGLAVRMSDRQYDAVVSIPEGAANLFEAVEMPALLPRGIRPTKVDRREFEFRHPASIVLIKRAGRLAIFDDVITTGGTPMAMAETIRHYNPEATIDLYAIWRRDQLDPRVDEVFTEQAYLVEEVVPSWPAEDCSCQH